MSHIHMEITGQWNSVDHVSLQPSFYSLRMINKQQSQYCIVDCNRLSNLASLQPDADIRLAQNNRSDLLVS